MDGDFSAMMWKFEALMICGWDGLHGMDPWMTEEDIEWCVKINNMTNCLLSGWPNSDGQQDSSFYSSLQIIIGFNCDHLIYDISLGISCLFYEFQSVDIEGRSIIYHDSFDGKI